MLLENQLKERADSPGLLLVLCPELSHERMDRYRRAIAKLMCEVWLAMHDPSWEIHHLIMIFGFICSD